MSKIFEWVFVLGVCACALAATAEEGKDARARQQHAATVRFGDLNLETEKGVQAMYVRLRNAADDVCGVSTGPVVLELKVRQARCIRSAIGNAVAKVNSPQLTAYYRAKTGLKDEQLLSKL